MNANVNIVGNGYTINMNNADRAFFIGPVTVNSGTLLTTGSVAALANVTSIELNGGAFALGQIGGITNEVAVTLAGGSLEAAINLTQNFGTLTVAGGTSVINFSTYAATFNFATLSLAPSSQLAIWNYAGADDVLRIATGTATGSLSQIAFYSDAGTTYLGEGSFVGTTIVPVPEPSTLVIGLAGLAGIAARGSQLRRRRQA
ncbi:MAG: PEP-CTERM sorting domain-containing protein [Pirellulales bacterium]